jgi:hypothetical protein
MKKITILLLMFLFGLVLNIQAQSCTPSYLGYTTVPAAGIILPSQLPNATNGIAYQQALTFGVPSSITISGNTIPVNWIKINHIESFIGNTWTVVNETGGSTFAQWNASTWNCATLLGTPTVSGTDSIIVFVDASVTFLGSPMPVSNQRVYSLPLVVENQTSMPFAAGAIVGASIVCQGQSAVTYTIPVISNATSYLWTLPSGFTGTSTTNSITVDYASNAVSGDITVCGVNASGNGTASTLSVTVNSLLGATGTISGAATVCQGQNAVTYSVPDVAGATSYIWTMPTGATGTSTASSITVNYGTSALSGDVTVKATNACGDGDVSTLNVTVDTKPTTPVITNSGSNVLHSDATSGNQWYDLNGIITGATSQNYTVVANGSYHVIVSNATCASEPSNTIQITNTGIADIKTNSTINIYPNPAKNQINVTVDSKLIGSTYTVKDQIGRTVLSGKMNADNFTIELGGLSGGVYLFGVGETSKQTFKVVKE